MVGYIKCWMKLEKNIFYSIETFIIDNGRAVVQICGCYYFLPKSLRRTVQDHFEFNTPYFYPLYILPGDKKYMKSTKSTTWQVKFFHSYADIADNEFQEIQLLDRYNNLHDADKFRAIVSATNKYKHLTLFELYLAFISVYNCVSLQ